jgi:hypothetical protein
MLVVCHTSSVCEFLGFSGGVDEVSAPTEYDAALQGMWLPIL